MTRPRLNMKILKNQYKEVENTLKSKELFVCQMENGVTVFIEPIENNNLDCMMVNPNTYKKNGCTTWVMTYKELEMMYKQVLDNKKYKHYSVEKQEYKMKDLFESLLDALRCLNTGNDYNSYRIRKLD
jgi:hypothetical protein